MVTFPYGLGCSSQLIWEWLRDDVNIVGPAYVVLEQHYSPAARYDFDGLPGAEGIVHLIQQFPQPRRVEQRGLVKAHRNARVAASKYTPWTEHTEGACDATQRPQSESSDRPDSVLGSTSR